MLETFILLNTLFVIGVIIYYAIQGIFKGLTSHRGAIHHIEYNVKNKFSKDKEFYVVEANYIPEFKSYVAIIGRKNKQFRKRVAADNPFDLEREISAAYKRLMDGNDWTLVFSENKE